MKWAALASRGSIKNFLDLYFLDGEGLTLEGFLPLLEKKYAGARINTYRMIKSLSWFDDAEAEPWPVMRKSVEWEELKERFLKIQRGLFLPLE